MNKEELKEFLLEKSHFYNQLDFIEEDPIGVVHQFSLKQDIEISGFLISSIAWGKRAQIIKSAHRMMEIMDNSPYDFVLNHNASDLKRTKGFVHRTFCGEDLEFFFKSLQNIYQNHEGLENLFQIREEENNPFFALQRFREIFFSLSSQERTQKHIANTQKGSAAKRLNMYLRWMVRNSGPVDFGLWKKIPTSKLSCPLDTHVGNIGRKLNLISRKQNDWKTVEELDFALREMHPEDPVLFDYAFMGLGIYEKF
ncbi:MAG: TIGR02757 family protein [Flavobacteriaceae bacterium]|nr:MAG: TIGR02757 family protein [Flavobacteriaceae bacterium]